MHLSPQSEEKYRCVSDSQCGPERFPSGGECSPFPTPSQLQGSSGTLEGNTSPMAERITEFHVIPLALIDAYCVPDPGGLPPEEFPGQGCG